MIFAVFDVLVLECRHFNKCINYCFVHLYLLYARVGNRPVWKKVCLKPSLVGFIGFWFFSCVNVGCLKGPTRWVLGFSWCFQLLDWALLDAIHIK